MRRNRFAAIALAALVASTAACSSDDDNADSAASTFSTAETAAAATSAAAPALSGGGDDAGGDGQNVAPGPDGKPAAPTTVVRGRVATGREDIIKNAALTIEAKDVDRARNDAAARAEALDAEISSETRAGTGKDKSATMVFRVLPGDFDNLVTAFSKLPDTEVVGSKSSTEDVTGQVADIEGRIGAAKDSAEKIRALIARAEKITDLVALEREYQARDAEIQSMTAQLASLKDRAGRSTVTLSIGPLTERAKELAPPKEKETGFIGGLKSGWAAFTATTVVLATAVGALLPFVAVVGVALLAWWIVRRRRPASPLGTSDATTPFATPTA